MDAGTLIELAKSGGMTLFAVVATIVGWALWNRVTQLQDRLFDTLATTSKELREMQATTNAALTASTTAMQAATTAMQAATAEMARAGR